MFLYTMLPASTHLLSVTMRTAPGVNFTNIVLAAFMCADPNTVKKDWQIDCNFCPFGICVHKSCLKNVDEINTWLTSTCSINNNKNLFLDTTYHLQKGNFQVWETEEGRIKYVTPNNELKVYEEGCSIFADLKAI